MGSAPTVAPAADVEHLKMIQSVVSRLAQNSFQIKGWSVTIVAATLAASSLSTKAPAAIIAFFPAVCFLILDVYYLRQERLFRALYEAASSGRAQRFSMDVRPYDGIATSWRAAARSPAILCLHAPIMLVIMLVLVAFAIFHVLKG